jgi:hypothetical protein
MPVVLAIAFGAVALGQIGLLASASILSHEPVASVARAKTLERNSLPASFASLRCIGFKMDQREHEDIFGEFSKVYEFRDEKGHTYLVSCDFPFSQGWHELTVCYKGIGWQVRDRKSRELSADNGETWTSIEAVLAKPDGQHGFVTWAIFDEDGQPVSPPLGRLRDQIWRLLVRRSPLIPGRTLFQVQVFTQSASKLTEEQKRHASKLLDEVRGRMRDLIARDWVE